MDKFLSKVFRQISNKIYLISILTNLHSPPPGSEKVLASLKTMKLPVSAVDAVDVNDDSFVT